MTIWKNIFTPFYPYVKQCQNNSNTQEKEANKNETLIKILIVLFFILHVIQDLLTFFSHFASQFRLMIIISTWFGHNKYIIAQDVNFWKEPIREHIWKPLFTHQYEMDTVCALKQKRNTENQAIICYSVVTYNLDD